MAGGAQLLYEVLVTEALAAGLGELDFEPRTGPPRGARHHEPREMVWGNVSVGHATSTGRRSSVQKGPAASHDRRLAIAAAEPTR